MKKTAVVFILMAFGTFIIAQSGSSFDLSVGLGMSDRNIFTGVKEVRNNKASYQIELGYNYQISNKWYFKTGLLYTTYNFRTTKLQELRWPSQHDGNGGFEPDASNNILLTSSNRFMGIPLLIRYEFIGEKFTPYLELGPAINLLVSSDLSANADTPGRNNSDLENFRSTNITGKLAAGTNVNINRQFQFFGALVGELTLHNYQEELINEQGYSFRLQLGIRKFFINPSKNLID